ncbi:Gfo/Idh/MocA family oxidoreductase [Halorarum halophilum]|uniref:Gfo/Idh/MocA family oxidoreductase n=1 Tax=Halorarum halophilum TaxID=2743090 RepID=A0A7D5GX64_9EURY|nr:D-xylose 1-dehydrogenase Gfo6 [Halobaculum halophilum]QLG27509.1 Gfo/Idh/MocA family oxidoreductase [Halobaculum halophilum]
MLENLFADAVARDWDDSPEGTLRIAVVGCGGHARAVSLPAIATADYCEPTVIVSGSAEKRAELGETYMATALDYHEYTAGQAVDEYDAVYVSTPNRLHLPHVETAARLGKAVICEKPLEATLERAERLVAACENEGVPLMTAYRMQAAPVVRRLREFLRGGGIGEPQRAFGDFTYPALDGERGPDQWRLDPELAGAGALFDLGIYPLNTVRFLFDSDPVAAWGDTRSTGEAFAEVDEHSDFSVDFGEYVGNFSASFSGYTTTRLTVQGTHGRVVVDPAFGSTEDRDIMVETKAGRVRLVGVGANETREEFDYFANAVLTGGEIESDGEDGLVDMRTMTAVLESAETGSRVDVRN